MSAEFEHDESILYNHVKADAVQIQMMQPQRNGNMHLLQIVLLC